MFPDFPNSAAWAQLAAAACDREDMKQGTVRCTVYMFICEFFYKILLDTALVLLINILKKNFYSVLISLGENI